MTTGDDCPLTGVVACAATVSNQFPLTPNPNVHRENVLATLDETLEGKINAVIVEGPPEIGKTTLLAQFALRHPSRTVAIFIRAASRHTYDIEVVQAELCNQVHWLLYQRELPENEAVDARLLLRLSYKLQSHARRTGMRLNFVIDGLLDLPPEEDAAVHAIIEMLPTGDPRARFLFSGDAQRLKQFLPNHSLQFKPYILCGFTIDEAYELFSTSSVDRAFVEEVWRVSKIPGYMVAVRRLIDQGVEPASLAKSLPERLPELFDREWNSADVETGIARDIVALIALDNNPKTPPDIAMYLDISVEEVQQYLARIHFVEIAPNGEVRLSSDSLRAYAAKRLASDRQKVMDRIIQRLSLLPSDSRSMMLLPRYLSEDKRYPDLLKHLSPIYFTHIIERSESLFEAKQLADLGVAAAISCERDSEIVRTTIQRTTLSGLNAFKISKAEVHVRTAIGDLEGAIALAHSTIPKRDRLMLLAAVVRAGRRHGGTVIPDIVAEIDQLVRSMDVRELEGGTIALASDLLYANPELAMRLLREKSSGRRDERDVEWALATASVRSLLRGEGNDDPLIGSASDLRTQIKDREAHEFLTGAAVLADRFTPSQVIREVEGLSSPGARLFLLRTWCRHTRHQSNAASVIDYAIRLALTTPEYTPTATDLADIATPLPNLSDLQERKNLIGMMSSQLGVIEQTGPSQDYLRLVLLLGRGEAGYDQQAADARLIEAFDYAVQRTDLEIKTHAMAQIVSAVKAMNAGIISPDVMAVEDLAEESLDIGISQLLQATANQFDVIRSILQTLALGDPRQALNVAVRLNTEARRDRALKEVILIASQRSPAKIDWDVLMDGIDLIVDPSVADESVLEVTMRLASQEPEGGDLIQGRALSLLGRSLSVLSPEERARAAAAVSSILASCPGLSAPLAQKSESVLSKSLGEVDDGWARVMAHLDAASILAEHRRELALDLLGKARGGKNDEVSEPEMLGLGYCINLATRAYCGLLRAKAGTDQDWLRLDRYISSIASTELRIQIWSDLALRCFGSGAPAEARKIVEQKIKPQLRDARARSLFLWSCCAVAALPALYECHHETAIDLIREIPAHLRDEACASVSSFIVRRIPPSDPYESHGSAKAHSISYETAVEIMNIAALMESDSWTYFLIDTVASGVVSKRSNVTSTQRADLARRVADVSAHKFPNSRFIQHDGFKILADAQTIRLNKRARASWPDLFERARQISNISDRAYVMAQLVPIWEDGSFSDHMAALKEAHEIAQGVPSPTDRVDRCTAIAEIAVKINAEFAKAVIRDAMEFVRAGGDSEEVAARERLVSLAHSIDEGLSGALASSLDDDIARKNIREKLEVLDLKKELLSLSAEGGAPNVGSIKRLSEAAWMALGALNAGRAAPAHASCIRKYLEVASKAPLNRSFPVFAWGIQNIIERRSGSAESVPLLREMFRATLDGCELSSRVIIRSGDATRSTRRSVPLLWEEEGDVVNAGDRGQAMERLREWIENEAAEYLKICDPYFYPEDLEVLQLILAAAPHLNVSILTGRRHLTDQGVKQPWDETFNRVWREDISDQPAPATEVCIVGDKGGTLPIHQRWWITKGCGLNLGTSFNSIGKGRISEIVPMSPEEARLREREIDSFLIEKRREFQGQRLSYVVFPIW